MRNQPETRITSKLVDILEEMRHGWTIEVESNPFTAGSKKLDAFVTYTPQLFNEKMSIYDIMSISLC